MTNVIPWRKPSSSQPVIRAILHIVGSAVNFFLLLYKHSTQLLKTILNTVKRWLEYFAKFLVNFVSEMLVLLRTFITVLLSSLVKFGRRVAAPLVFSYGIALITLTVVEDIRQNILIQDTTVYAFLQHLTWPLLHCVLLFLATIVFVWAVGSHKFAETINSVGVSNVYVVFTLVITTLIGSGFLWVLAQFLESSPFKSFGYFTAIGSVGIAIILVGLFIWQNVMRRGTTTVP
ncbi:MAG TPA: hypothetical protein VK582_24405 [Pyrinomonadaceae bacterium]|nr:hypothetical protein [Pyrinomonadaceae bacterium]